MRNPALFVCTIAVSTMSSLLCLSPRALGQTNPGKFSVGNVWAKYVTGTKPQEPSQLGKLGCLESTDKQLLFSQRNVSWGSIWIKFWDWRLTERFVHLFNPSWGKGPCRTPTRNDFSIEFGNIRVLSRGQVLAAGGTDHKSPVDALTALGGFAGLATAVGTKNQGTVVLALGSAAGLLGTTALIAQLNKKTDNYITIFYNCQDTESSLPGTAPPSIHVLNSSISGSQIQANPSTSSSDELFKKNCDVAIFQIIDPHDYWNLSQLLTARTGLEFVAQTAEKGAPAK